MAIAMSAMNGNETMKMKMSAEPVMFGVGGGFPPPSPSLVFLDPIEFPVVIGDVDARLAEGILDC